MLGAAVIGAAEPLRPLQLLWLNLFSEALPALGLAFEPGEPDVLDRGPGRPDAPLLDQEARQRIVRDGIRLAGLGAVALVAGGPAVAFATLAAAQIGYAATCRAGGSPPAREFLGFVGGAAGLQAAGLQAAALVVAGLRTVLGLPVTPSVAEFVGFGTGLLVPALLWNRDHFGDVIVGRRLAAAPPPMTNANMKLSAAR